MSAVVKNRKPKRKTDEKAPRNETVAASSDVEPAVPSHVVGKPAEVEPVERAFGRGEEPESAMRSAEAPDAGYGRCTESSDWENRGRS